MKRHFRSWGALYILAALFLGSLVGHYVYQVLVNGDDFGQFMASVFENWQSEWLQLFVQALLINALGHMLYKVEKEDEERIERKLDKILHHLEK